MRAPAAALELRGLWKSFGRLVAVRDVSLLIPAGTITGIVGENGAGKSTLMNLVYGMTSPDAGEILVGGRAARISSPREAIALGIGMVHQHFMLVDTFTVAENVALGAERAATLTGSLAEARRELARLAGAYGLAVDPEARVGDLPIGDQQRVEILKVLYRGARLLILDEPTAVLTPQEADGLFGVLRELAGGGVTVVLVTHKLREIMAVTSRVVVMRAGAVVAERATRETSPDELAGLMIGASAIPAPSGEGRAGAERRTGVGVVPMGRLRLHGGTPTPNPSPQGGGARVGADGRDARNPLPVGERSSRRSRPGEGDRRHPDSSYPPHPALSPSGRGFPASTSGPESAVPSPLLQTRGLGLRDPRTKVALLDGIDLDLRAGEIVGVAGVSGNGQSELLEVLAGMRPPSAGTIRISRRAVSPERPAGPAEMRRLGIAHVPEHRHRHGIVDSFPAYETALLGAPPGRTFIDWRAVRHLCGALMRAADVRPPDPDQLTGRFSGGNQQKLVMAREIGAAPRILLVGQPTRGVDIGAVAAIHGRLRALREGGCAILLVSAELDELLTLADRIVVMLAGRIVGTVAGREADPRRLGLLMSGGDAAPATAA